MDESGGWRIVSTQSEFLHLQPDWEHLYSRNDQHSPFQAWGWVNAWLTHLAGSHELLIACHRDSDGQLDFILPLIRRSGGGIGRPRVMLACGFGPDCSEKLGSLYAPEIKDKIGTMVAAAMSRFLRPNDIAYFAPLDERSQSVDNLVSAISAECRKASLRPDVVCPTLELPGNWEEFLQQLSSNFRSQVRRSLKNFAEGDDLVIRTIAAKDAERFTRELIRLNKTRMLVKGNVSSMEDSAFEAFLLDAIPYMALQDIAWMDAIEADSTIVGVALNFFHGRNIYYYSGGFEDRFSKSRPGTALFAVAIQRGIELGYTSFNFLRGSESYKYRWGARDVVDLGVVVLPADRLPRVLAVAADRGYALVDALRQASRRMRARLR
jgi:CelD/BcsL family acetyltransferase involved in cellulose biosynthesis